ncbi:LLM class flavin-dependent oxidoreductase [Allokutzneria oryzae]|uniref:LLM class flavin-dependent oxidoreductase n=1 Tax=Allokutzneria oryzae TaxID=1378989 RepID=A0ABV5ZT82_9PSEU
MDMADSTFPLSVLDLATVAEGSSDAAALRRSVELAQHVESLGYQRFWTAEHHSMPTIASSSPDLLALQVGNATSTIRVGSGGVMLPNHSPLVVAERFAFLEAFHPGRVDLGIGRAPGTDQRTAAAVRRHIGHGVEDFTDQLTELEGYLDGALPEGHAFTGVHAVPTNPTRPPVWLLGSSGYSAALAAQRGRPFAFAYHFAPDNAAAALRHYREAFRPSPELAEPYAILTVGVIAADTAAEAERLAMPTALSMARLRAGRPTRLPSPETVERHEWTPGESAAARNFLSTYLIGEPDDVAARLRRLVGSMGADEAMITSIIHSAKDQQHSYTLLAEAMR